MSLNSMEGKRYLEFNDNARHKKINLEGVMSLINHVINSVLNIDP